MMRKILFHIVLLLVTSSSQAQQAQWTVISQEELATVFVSLQEWHEMHTDYALRITHTSFEDHLTTIPYEKSTGYFQKAGSYYHSFLLGIHSIQTAKYKIVIDTTSATLIVANSNPGNIIVHNEDDYSYLLAKCRSQLVHYEGGDKRYRLEFDEGFLLEKYELLVSHEGFLKAATWYYSSAVPVDPDQENSRKSKPRLNISFTLESTNEFSGDKKKFEASTYFITDGNKLLPVGKYKDFTVSDQRLTLD